MDKIEYKMLIVGTKFLWVFFAAIQKKPIGESRTPTDFWSGLGFSKSMPESAIRERMQQTGVRQKYEPPMATTYEVSISLHLTICGVRVSEISNI
jgi:hypothetical protein